MKRLFILFFLPLLFLLGGCFKEKEIILNPSDGITPDQEWAVVKIPYAAFLEKTEYDSEVKSHGRLGDVFLVIGKEFVKKRFFDDESEKTNNLCGCPIVHFTDNKTNWYRVTEFKWLTPWRAGNKAFDEHTILSYEISKKWEKGDETFYPVFNERSLNLHH